MAKPRFKVAFEEVEEELREEVLPRLKFLLENLTRKEEKAKITKLLKSFNLPTLEQEKMKMSKTSKKDYGKAATKDDLRKLKKDDVKQDKKMIKAVVKKVKGKK